jgi:hypothetical protein
MGTKEVGCNICNEKIAQQLVAGTYINNQQKFVEAKLDRWCPVCTSRRRQRYGHYIIMRDFFDKKGKCLTISCDATDAKLLNKKYEILNVSLYGKQGGTCVTGVDITKPHKILKENEFDLVYCTCVFDFIENMKAGFSLIHKYLKPGGAFLFYIMPYRLTEDAQKVVVKTYNARPDFSFPEKQPKGKISGVPNLTVGKKWVINALKEVGFKYREYNDTEIFSGMNCYFFCGIK